MNQYNVYYLYEYPVLSFTMVVISFLQALLYFVMNTHNTPSDTLKCTKFLCYSQHECKGNKESIRIKHSYIIHIKDYNIRSDMGKMFDLSK